MLWVIDMGKEGKIHTVFGESFGFTNTDGSRTVYAQQMDFYREDQGTFTKIEGDEKQELLQQHYRDESKRRSEIG